MAIITPSWTESIGLTASTVLAAGASVSNDIDFVAAGYDLAQITVQSQFGATPDDNVEFLVYSSSDNGLNFDTQPILVFQILAVSNQTLRRTFLVNNVAQARITARNLDSADNITYESWYAGRKWSSV